MKKSLVKLILINVVIAIVLLVIFYFSAFLSGYGSNINYLPQEKKLFMKFAISHLIINLFLIYRLKQFGSIINIIISMLFIITLYLFVAWRLQYFSQ